MDPPPLPPTATTAAAAATTTVAAAQLMNYPDSIDSSPRSRQTDTWDEPLLAVPGAKLRLMCSYGGHIIPRPHDKSLCYVGGDTRIVVADRQSPLADFCSRLSRTLLQGRHFTLKYQLPNEELDSLVSVTTDEDLENMIEEYDRLTSACSSLKPTRLRLFLFPSKPETSASMGSLLDDAKSETWFVDALNGSGLLPRGLSESAVMNNLLELDDGVIVNTETCTDMDAQIEPMSGNNTNKLVKVQDVHSNMPDSPVVETNSSFGSSSSSPSMSNLPPIRVRVDEGSAKLYDQMAGLDEQLSQMNVTPPPLPIIIGGSVMVSTGCNSGAGHNEHSGRVLSDDDRSDQGAPSGFRKPPLPLQPVPRKLGQDPYALPSPDSKHAGVYNLPSPDSVTSDSSIASATSFSKHTLCQDPTLVAGRETRPPVAKNFPNNFPEAPSSQVQMQQVPDTMYIQAQQQNQQQQQQQQAQDTMYTQALQQNQQQQQVQDTMYAQALQQNQQQQQQVQDTMYAQALQQNQQQQQQQQQQFIHASTHYIHHPGTNPVPISSYYPIYTTTSSQQPQLHPQMDPQYQTYYMPVPQNQAYNVTVQSNIGDPTTNPANNVAATPPLYPTKAASLVSTKPEMLLNAPYRTGTPTLVQVPSNQFQSQYVMSQTPHYPPSQPTAAAAAAAASNYGYEYAKATQEQVNYYPQHSVVAMPSQYQTMTSAAAVLLSQASAQQQAAENANQQIGSSQPL